MGAPDSSVIPWRAQPRSTSAQAAQVTTGWKASKKKNTNITRSRLHTMGKRYGLLQLPFRVNCAQNLPGFFRRLNWNTNSIFHTGPSHVFILCILLLSEEVPTAPAHGSWQRVVKLTHKKTCKGTRTEIGHVMTCCHFDGHRFSCIQPSQHNRKQNIYIYISLHLFFKWTWLSLTFSSQFAASNTTKKHKSQSLLPGRPASCSSDCSGYQCFRTIV